MLQQTQVATVLPYYERWMRELPGIAALASASDEKLLKLWEGLGYYSRVRNLKKAAGVILQQHSGVFPSDFEKVLDLPGIGPYTAGAICSIAFNQPTPILDGNVARVLARVFAISGDTKERGVSKKLWQRAEALVGFAHADGQRDKTKCSSCGHLNESLMELGALVCLPVNPKCDVCPIARQCCARLRDVVDRFPQRRRRPTTQRRRLIVFVIGDGKTVLVRQRPAGTPNAGFWEFPFVEARNGESALELLKIVLPGGRLPRPVRPLGNVSHSIMNARFQVEAHEVLSAIRGHCEQRAPGRARKPVPSAGLEPRKIASLETLPFSTISRKVLRMVTG